MSPFLTRALFLTSGLIVASLDSHSECPLFAPRAPMPKRRSISKRINVNMTSELFWHLLPG